MKRYDHSGLRCRRLPNPKEFLGIEFKVIPFFDKFEVTEDFWISIGKGEWAFQRSMYWLGPDGTLTVKAGTHWDGSSGPTVDTDADKVPSLVHDMLYGAMKKRRLPLSLRKWSDRLYRDLLIQHGKPRLVAVWRYVALRLFGRKYASPDA